MKRKIKILCNLIISCLIILFEVGCDKVQAIEINDEVGELLEIMGVENCKIKNLGNYEGLIYEKADISVSEAEIEERIFEVMESYAELTEITDRTIVQNGDIVYIDYKTYEEEQLVNKIQGEVLKVGAGYFDETIEAELIGREINNMFEISYISENGMQMEFEIVVTSINQFKTYELTDEFVQKEFNTNTVEEYREQIRYEIEEEKRTLYLVQQQEKLLNDVIENSSYELDRDEIAKYSIQVISNYENIALIMYDSLEEYINNELCITEDEFYEMCYEEGEMEIKQYLTIGAIAEQLNMEVGDNELEKLANENDYDIEKVKEDTEVIDSMIFYLLNARVRAYLYNRGECY